MALGWQGRRVRRVFVGRERRWPHSRIACAGRKRYGQVVGIAGEPGIGKSRLLYEFREQMRHKPSPTWRGAASPMVKPPYLPLLDSLRQACGPTESDAITG